MAKATLKRLLSPEVLLLLKTLQGDRDFPLCLQSVEGNFLVGSSPNLELEKYPVVMAEELLGWVWGKEAQVIASFLNFLAERELEKRSLAKEVLDKYREINLLYTISEKLTACLDRGEIARLVIGEAIKILPATSISIMLLDEETQYLEIIAAHGVESPDKVKFTPQQGIASFVMLSGVAEVVNDVSNDPRFVPGSLPISSIICAPIKTKTKSIGVMNISYNSTFNYSSQDLKFAMGLASIASSAIENALLHEDKLKEERIKSQLERYIPPQLVDAIIAKEGDSDISFEPMRKRIAILFSDIRSFTTKCEELPPEVIVTYLNEYFTQMVDVIFSKQGTVNKFVGDMIVAMFGAPSRLLNSEKQAIEAAMGMQERLRSVSIPWIRDNFLTGIGISSGEVVIGNIGSPQHLDYTAIGDEVNLASRLQGIAKGGQILVSSSVYEVTQDLFEFRSFGRINVKGKKKSVDVFEVLY